MCTRTWHTDMYVYQILCTGIKIASFSVKTHSTAFDGTFIKLFCQFQAQGVEPSHHSRSQNIIFSMTLNFVLCSFFLSGALLLSELLKSTQK